jgi:hypothetical protein
VASLEDIGMKGVTKSIVRSLESIRIGLRTSKWALKAVCDDLKHSFVLVSGETATRKFLVGNISRSI